MPRKAALAGCYRGISHRRVRRYHPIQRFPSYGNANPRQTPRIPLHPIRFQTVITIFLFAADINPHSLPKSMFSA